MWDIPWGVLRVGTHRHCNVAALWTFQSPFVLIIITAVPPDLKVSGKENSGHRLQREAPAMHSLIGPVPCSFFLPVPSSPPSTPGHGVQTILSPQSRNKL